MYESVCVCAVFPPFCGWFVQCVCLSVCFKHTEQIGPQAWKCSALIVCDFVEVLKGFLPLNHRDRERERQRREVKERVEREQKKEGDKILITMFCIHPNPCVFCVSSRVLVKAGKMISCKKLAPKTLNSQRSLKALRWAVVVRDSADVRDFLVKGKKTGL